MSKSVWDSAKVGAQSDTELAFRTLFPTEDKFVLTQMLSDLSAGTQMPMTMLGVFRRKYHSKTLQMFQEEYNYNKFALDRKGRLEGSEIVVHRAGPESGKDGDD
jgi:hypothetical protein